MNEIGSFYPAGSIEQVRDSIGAKKTYTVTTVGNPEQGSFSQALAKAENKNETLRFSGHAQSRLSSRGIQMNENQMDRLTQAKTRAQEKGIKDSLILLDDMAFIVNVPNSTVVTAVGTGEDTSNIFTNIDGAVIA